MKFINQNLYDLAQRLMVITLLILLCSQLFIAYFAAVYVIPYNAQNRYGSALPNIRIGVETHSAGKKVFENLPEESLTYSVTELSEAYASYHGFIHNVFDIVITDFLTARLLSEKHDGVPIAFECEEDGLTPLRDRFLLVSSSFEGDAWRAWVKLQADLKKRQKVLSAIEQLEYDAKKGIKYSEKYKTTLKDQLKEPLIDTLRLSRSVYFKFSDKADKALLAEFKVSQSLFIHEYQEEDYHYLVIDSNKGEKTIQFTSEDGVLKFNALINDGSRGTSFFSQTKGTRLLLTGKKTQVKRMVTEIFIRVKTNKQQKWFEKVDYLNSATRALNLLSENKADVVSVEEKVYKRYIKKKPGISKRFKVLWYSNPITRSVVVVKKKAYAKMTAVIERMFPEKTLYSWKLFKDSTESFEDWTFKINGHDYSYEQKHFFEEGHQ